MYLNGGDELVNSVGIFKGRMVRSRDTSANFHFDGVNEKSGRIWNLIWLYTLFWIHWTSVVKCLRLAIYLDLYTSTYTNSPSYETINKEEKFTSGRIRIMYIFLFHYNYLTIMKFSLSYLIYDSYTCINIGYCLPWTSSSV